MDLAGSDLTILRALFDVLYELLLLVLKFGSLAIELSLRLLESSLVFPQSLRRRHALSERPFNDLVGVSGA